MKATYRYRVTLCVGLGPFLSYETTHAGEAINVACMLQKAQGKIASPGDWNLIRDRNQRSVTADNIELSRQMISGDMSELMAEDAQPLKCKHGVVRSAIPCGACVRGE